jgi:hypothetical protein
MGIRTASAHNKLFLIRRLVGGEMLVKFVGVSDSLAHHAVVEFKPTSLVWQRANVLLSSLIEVDQEAAKVIWLLQTGEEL